MGSSGFSPSLPFQNRGRWYIAAYTAAKFLPYFNRDVLFQTSAMIVNAGFSWFYFARGATGDFAAIGVEDHLDFSRLENWIGNRYGNGCLPGELGWFGFLSKIESRKDVNDSFASTSPDEIEYLMNRALGYNLPIGLETTWKEIQAHGRYQEIFDIIGKYEKLRQLQYFPESMLKNLRDRHEAFRAKYNASKVQYHLVQRDLLNFGLRKQVFLEKVMKSGESWTFENPFEEQSLNVKITALPAPKTSSIELLNVHELNVSRHPTGGNGDEMGKCIHANGAISCHYLPIDPSIARTFEWCRLDQPLSNLDLTNYKTLQVTFEGEAKGQVIHIQLHNGPNKHRIYEIEMAENRIGRQTIIFDQPTVTGFYKNPPRHGGLNNFRFFDYSNITGLTIYVKKIPQDCLNFYIHSITAHEQDPDSMLHNPTVRIDSQEVIIPIELNPSSKYSLNAQPWEFVELTEASYTKYDGNHHKIEKEYFTNLGYPKVKLGFNTLNYRHQGTNNVLVRILLEDKVEYPPF